MKRKTTSLKLLPVLFLAAGIGRAGAQPCFDAGTGLDGAYTATVNTTLAGGTYNYTNFTINSGVIVTVTGTQPLIIRCTGTATIDGLLRANGGNGGNGVTFSTYGIGGVGVAGGANGGDGSYSGSLGPLPGVAGAGSGGAINQGGAWSGGGGAGYSAAATSTLNGAGGFGGAAYGTPQIAGLEPGSGGGGGSGGYSCGAGGGGAGGGLIVINAGVSIVIGATGAVYSNGGNGGSDGTGNCGGGGGGSGGALWLAAPAMTNSGAISAIGGTGGASQVNYSPYWGGGTNGANGRIRLDYNGALGGSGTVNPAVGYTTGVSVSTLAAGTPAATNITCNGANNGSATVTPSGGTSPYTYSWAPSGGTAATASGLAPGTYTVTVTDASGCGSSLATVTITEPAVLAASVSAQTNVLCFGNANGSATVTETGGTGPFTYSWAPSGGTAATASGLTPGSYTCTVTDANGCSTTTSVSITEPTALGLTVETVTDPTTCGGADGAINMSFSGGTPGYTYMWNNGGMTEDISGLVAGSYSVTVTDVNGCTLSSGMITLTDPPAPTVTMSLVMDSICSSDPLLSLIGTASPSGGTFAGTGVTGTDFTPSVGPGVYAITYSYTDANNCSASTVDSITVDICTGLFADNSTNSLQILPNPNNGTFVIQLGSTREAVTLTLRNALGQTVKTMQLPAGKNSVDMSGLSQGIYLLDVANADGKMTKKIVVR